MRFDDRRLQHHEAEIFVDTDVHVDQPLHDRLVFDDAAGDELHQIVVAARDEMAFDDLNRPSRRRQETGKVDLPMVLQRDFRKNRQRLPELGDIDLRRIA
jgi:hypothetical protein